MKTMLRYSVTVQFDIVAGDADTLQTRLNNLTEVGTVTAIKARSAGLEPPKGSSLPKKLHAVIPDEVA